MEHETQQARLKSKACAAMNDHAAGLSLPVSREALLAELKCDQ
jgi:hypothetical protein